ncbi:polysaccharide deacetylase family protein [candidate division KSB1 bacterium]|nr:polysaccharide deacetylase family protein [candidate division KSB1 bacterium]
MKLPGINRLRRAARRLKGSHASGGIILLYHRVAEVSSNPWGLCVSSRHFAEHLEVLRKRGFVMPLGQLLEALRDGKLSRLHVAVSFDDGYADNLHAAKPLLERYETPATFFLTTGYIDRQREFWWDELERILLRPGKLPETLQLSMAGRTFHRTLGKAAQLSDDDFRQHRSWKAWEEAPSPRHELYYSLWQTLQMLRENERRKAMDELAVWAGVTPAGRQTHWPLSNEEVMALAKGELFEIGDHTATHPLLSALPAVLQREEIQQSKAHLEEILERPVTSFSYPHGNYTAETVALVRAAGFTCACSTVAGIVRIGTDCLQLPRVQVGDWDGEVFNRWLSRSFFSA